MKKIILWALGLLAAGAAVYFFLKNKKSEGESGGSGPTPDGATSNTRGERNNNPCNITPVDGGWDGQVGIDTTGDTPYVKFSTPTKGIRAAGVNALNYYYKDGITTLNGFKRWGPAGNSDYGTKLADQIGIDEYATFDVYNNLESLLKAISVNENSEVPYTESDWTNGVDEALAAKQWGS